MTAEAGLLRERPRGRRGWRGLAVGVALALGAREAAAAAAETRPAGDEEARVRREAELFARGAALPYDRLEDAGVAQGLIPRASASRRLGDDVTLLPPRPEAPIVASLYVLPSAYFAPGEVADWLAAVRATAPARTLVVVTDLPLRRALAGEAGRLGARLVESWGVPFSPWPRDPLALGRAADGRLVLLERPNVQRGREADAVLARALVAGLPADLDAAWGGVAWRPAPVPFHNGQVLVTDDAAWVSIHSLEPRALELAGLDRVPVAAFDGEPGARYLAAVRRAADELAAVYGLQARFVHRLPAADGPGLERAAALRRLGGGAGFDLDSLLTLLPADDVDRRTVALVADPGLAAGLLAATAESELDAFATALGLAPRGAPLRAALAAASQSRAGAALGGFLDEVAKSLAADGLEVVRLPLVWVPRELERERRGDDGGFLVGWQNVVLERRSDGARAEGFSGLLSAGDAAARRAFEAAGYELALLPPLVASVVRNGGYRCASQHVRADRPPESR